MSELYKHFDRGILQGIDHAGDPGPGLELVRDQVNNVSDFHAFLAVAEARERSPAYLTISAQKNSL